MITRTSAWRAGVIALACAVLGGCNEDKQTALPPPQEPTTQAIGYYCKMALTEHDGPKGQIFVRGQAQPLWFSSVRDTLLYTRMEGMAQVTAIYVNDMGHGDGHHPIPGVWVDATKAVFIIENRDDPLPFSERLLAEAFVARQGNGRIVALSEIPDITLFKSAANAQ